MADVMPDYQVEQLRLRSQISSLRSNLDRYYLDIAESESRKKGAYDNIDATEKAIAECEKNLKAMETAHGKVELPKRG